MRFHINKNDSGSVTIETAVVMPAFIGVLLFFISLFQITAAENILNFTALKTADKMCKWAPIYKNLLIDNAQDVIFEGIKDEIVGEFGDALNSELDNFIMSIFDLRKIGEYSMDYIYGFTAQKMCESSIEDNVLIKKGIVDIKNVNLYKSNFFHKDTNFIDLIAICDVDTYLPFDVKISSEVKCFAWGSGVMPHISVKEETEVDSSTESIWKADNFTRGQVIRQMYGANLPDTFPVIAAFDNGMATMIKSINHMATTYQKSSVFEQTVRRMINDLSRFEGGEAGNIKVKSKDIYCKRLLLVLPENDLSLSQQKALENLMRYATSKLIVLDLQRYQKV